MTLTEYYDMICRDANKDGKYPGTGIAIKKQNFYPKNIDLRRFKATMTSLPDFSWLELFGEFNIEGCDKLLSLKGSPKSIRGSYICNHCTALQDLIGAPEYIQDSFECYGCDGLTTLKGSPKEVGSFSAESKNLISIDGCPKKCHPNNFRAIGANKKFYSKKEYMEARENTDTLEHWIETLKSNSYNLPYEIMKKLVVNLTKN